MRRSFALVAAAGFALAALSATAPAEAGYHLVRFQSNGFCQIWDDNVPNLLDRSVYSVATYSVPTLIEAMANKEVLLRQGACTF